MYNKIIKELIKVSNNLDSIGLYKEANYLDSLIKLSKPMHIWQISHKDSDPGDPPIYYDSDKKEILSNSPGRADLEKVFRYWSKKTHPNFNHRTHEGWYVQEVAGFEESLGEPKETRVGYRGAEPSKPNDPYDVSWFDKMKSEILLTFQKMNVVFETVRDVKIWRSFIRQHGDGTISGPKNAPVLVIISSRDWSKSPKRSDGIVQFIVAKTFSYDGEDEHLKAISGKLGAGAREEGSGLEFSWKIIDKEDNSVVSSERSLANRSKENVISEIIDAVDEAKGPERFESIKNIFRR